MTSRQIVQFTDPSYVGPCDGSVGTLTVEGEEVVHLTDTGRTFRVQVVLRATFTVLFSPGGGAEIKVDSTRCGGELIA